MNCPSCGEVCHCVAEPPPAVLSDSCAETVVTDPGQVVDSPGEPIAVDRAAGNSDSEAWRDELSARLNRYRSRHKIRPPRYPSLRLPFSPFETIGSHDALPEPTPTFQPVSNQALALDGLTQGTVSERADEPSVSGAAKAAGSCVAEVSLPESSAHTGAKIIEFPRFNFEPAPPPPNQLAEPVSDGLRILEVPEVAPPPPALGGITIEPAERQEFEKRPGIDIPLQSASLSRRIFASLIDGALVTVAAAIFGFIFWKITSIQPPQGQMLGMVAGLPCLFWAVYQYLLIVYAGGTPGLRAAGLELARFDGSVTSRSLRRWRVIASYLSAASLGMGYIWVFLDEDVLCWHDRITHTYLAPRKASSGP